MKPTEIPFHKVLEALEEHKERRLRLKRRLDEIGKELRSIVREVKQIEGK